MQPNDEFIPLGEPQIREIVCDALLLQARAVVGWAGEAYRLNGGSVSDLSTPALWPWLVMEYIPTTNSLRLAIRITDPYGEWPTARLEFTASTITPSAAAMDCAAYLEKEPFENLPGAQALHLRELLSRVSLYSLEKVPPPKEEPTAPSGLKGTFRLLTWVGDFRLSWVARGS